MRLTSIMPEVLELPDSADKRDLEWCASIAEWTPIGPELRAMNTAIGIALRLLKERASEKTSGDPHAPR